MNETTSNGLPQYNLNTTAPVSVAKVAHAVKENSPLPWVKELSEDQIRDQLIADHHLKAAKNKKKAQFSKGQKIYLAPYLDNTYPQQSLFGGLVAMKNQVSRKLDKWAALLTGETVTDPAFEALKGVQHEFTAVPVKPKKATAKAETPPKPEKFKWPTPSEMAYLKDTPNLPKQHTVGSDDTSYGRLAFQLRTAFPEKTNYEVAKLLQIQYGNPVQGKTYDLQSFYNAASKNFPSVKTAENLPANYTLDSRDTSFVSLSQDLKPHFPNHSREQVQSMLEMHFGKPIPNVKLDLTGFFDRLQGISPIKHEASATNPLTADAVKAHVEKGVSGLKHAALLKKVLPHQAFQESQWKPDAASKAQAKGLLQQMPHVAPGFGLAVNSQVDERYDAAKSMRAGAVQMNQLLIENDGDLTLALKKYNGGNANLESKESVNYARDIQAMMDSGEPGPKNPFWVAKMEAIQQAKADKATTKKSMSIAAKPAKPEPIKPKPSPTETLMAKLPKPATSTKGVIVAKAKPEKH